MLPFFYFCCMDFMQTDLGTLIRKTRLLSSAIAWYESIDKNVQEKIIDLIQNDQLQEGIDAKGKIIGYYSYATEIITKGKKQQGEPFTLFDTGEFYKSMYVVASLYDFVVYGDGQKTDKNLFQAYGDDIIGLTDLSKEKLAEILTEKYIKYVSEILSIG